MKGLKDAARTSVAASLLMIVAVASASAETDGKPPVFEGENFVLDYKKFIGKRVTISDCVIAGARLEFAGCFVGVPVMINVGYGKAPREVRKRAMDECAAADVKKRCFASVTGKVRSSATGQVIGLDDATVEWTFP